MLLWHTQGQRIRKYTIEVFLHDMWQEFALGHSIGHKRIELTDEPVRPSKARLVVHDAVAAPRIRAFEGYRPCKGGS